MFNFLGATLTMLWKQPPSDRDRDHRVRLAWGVPMPDWKPGMAARFGFPLYELYGLTDAGIPVYDPLDRAAAARSCGRMIAEYDVRIVDAPTTPFRAGTVGEITIRGREPGLVMNEYWGMPDATAHAFVVDGSTPATSASSTPTVTCTSSAGPMTRSGGGARTSRPSRSSSADPPGHRRGRRHRRGQRADRAGGQGLRRAAPGSGARPGPIRPLRRQRAGVHGAAVRRDPAELPKTPTQKIEKFRLEAANLSPPRHGITNTQLREADAVLDPTRRSHRSSRT